MSEYFVIVVGEDGYIDSLHQYHISTGQDTRNLLELKLRDETESIPIFWDGDGRKREVKDEVS